jgi:hypothetical protein
MSRRIWPLGLGLALAAACGGASVPAYKPVPHPPGRQARALAPMVPALHATQIARVPDGTFGPYLGQGKEGAVLAWAAAEGQQRSWYLALLDPDGAPRGAVRRLADAPPEVGLVVVRGSSENGSYTLVSTRRTALSEWVEVTFLNERGELVAGPRALAELRARALWVEVVPLGERRLVLWAVPNDTAADLYAVALNARAEPEGDPVIVSTGAKAWQAAPFAGSAALGTVGADGRVAVTFLDGRADPKGKPLTVSSAGHAELDFDLAEFASELVVAWSDTRDGESRVYRALIGADRSVKVPEAPLTPPLGEQALVRVVARPGASRAWIAWESPAERDGDTRMFDLAGVDPSGRVTVERARVALRAEDAAVPEVAAVGDGVAALTLASACEKGQPCDDPDVMPTYVRFGPKLELLASEPLRLEALEGSPVDLGWGLTCRENSCFALAALGDAPAPVYLVSLERRSGAWAPAGRAVGVEAPPRIRENKVLAKSDALADLALVKVGTGSLAAYLTDFDPTTPWVKLKKAAPDGRYEPLRAHLGLIGLKADGSALAAEQVLSLRAHSLGGVALSSPTGGGDVLAAWTGVDAGKPQVFLTLVGPDGARRTQRMLTRKGGDTSDVAATPVGKGWLVAWVDERDHDPELYVSRVDEKLARIGVEQRLTNAPGPATQAALATLGETAVIAWAEARDPAAPGEADIYLTHVATRDATPVGGERRVLATKGHSFAPALGRLGNGLALIWLERGSPDVPGSAAIMVESLDASGEPHGEPARLAIEQGEPTSLAVDCGASGCHLVVIVRSGASAALFAGVLREKGEPLALRRIAALGSPIAAGVPLALAGDELLYGDADEDAVWRVRRALLDWP